MGVVRLDKYLANLGIVSRRKIGKMISEGKIYVNGDIVKKSDIKLNRGDQIYVKGICGRNLNIKVIKDIVVLLHKSAGYVCSDVDEGNYPSYKKLLKDCSYKNILKLAY